MYKGLCHTSVTMLHFTQKTSPSLLFEAWGYVIDLSV